LSHKTGNRKRILVVEDDINTIIKIMDTLASQYDLILCSSGYHAVDNINNNEVDIILIDYDLPEMPGLQLFYLIKRMRPHIRALFLGTFKAPEILIESFRAGIDDFVLKPIDPEKLMTVIKVIERDMDRKRLTSPKIDETMPFEPVELMLMSDAGLLLYRRSFAPKKRSRSIFTGIIAAIQMAITEELESSDDEPLVIQTGKLVTMIIPEKGFNTVLIGTGQQTDSIRGFSKKMGKVIEDSGIIDSIKDRVIDLNALENQFIALRHKMPPVFHQFFK